MRLTIFIFVTFSIVLQCRYSETAWVPRTPLAALGVKNIKMQTESDPGTCTAVGSYPVPIIDWYIFNKKLSKNESIVTYDDIRFVAVSTLTRPLSDTEKRSYVICTARNPYFSPVEKSVVHKAKNLPLLGPVEDIPPMFNVESISITIGPILRCTVFGARPNPDIVWLVNAERVPNDLYTYNYDEEKLIAESSFDPLNYLENQPIFVTCSARNPNTEITVKSTSVIVKPEPKVAVKISDVVLSENVCTVYDSKPGPIITWYVNGVQVPKEHYTSQHAYNVQRQIATSVVDTSFLISDMEQILECRAVNPEFPDDIRNSTIVWKVPYNFAPEIDVIKVRIYDNPVRCEATGVTAGVRFRWWLKGNELKQTDFELVNVLGYNLTALSKLTIELPKNKWFAVSCVVSDRNDGVTQWDAADLYINTTSATQPNTPDEKSGFQEFLSTVGVDVMTEIAHYRGIYEDFTTDTVEEFGCVRKGSLDDFEFENFNNPPGYAPPEPISLVEAEEEYTGFFEDEFYLVGSAFAILIDPENKTEDANTKIAAAVAQIVKEFDVADDAIVMADGYFKDQLTLQTDYSTNFTNLLKEYFSYETGIEGTLAANKTFDKVKAEILDQLSSLRPNVVSLAGSSNTIFKPALEKSHNSLNDFKSAISDLKKIIYESAAKATDVADDIDELINYIPTVYGDLKRQFKECVIDPVTTFASDFVDVSGRLNASVELLKSVGNEVLTFPYDLITLHLSKIYQSTKENAHQLEEALKLQGIIESLGTCMIDLVSTALTLKAEIATKLNDNKYFTH